ncbi:MAG: DUF1007 family protein [Campylobacterota bacterium]|nr:DUF1007 family protein [Campylobacterota bacterium]
MFKYLIIFFLYLNISYAHPHTFIEVYPTILVEDKKVKFIKFNWIMDEMSSSMFIMEFDQNGDGNIDEIENNYVYNNYFLTLKNFNFYTNINIKGENIPFPNIKEFKSTIQDNRINFIFSVVPNIDINNTSIEFFDNDYFVAMILKEEFVISNAQSVKVKDIDGDFYFGYRLEIN